jgi:hypothetical protein
MDDFINDKDLNEVQARLCMETCHREKFRLCTSGPEVTRYLFFQMLNSQHPEGNESLQMLMFIVKYQYIYAPITNKSFLSLIYLFLQGSKTSQERFWKYTGVRTMIVSKTGSCFSTGYAPMETVLT